MMHLFAHPDRLWLLVSLVPLAAWIVRGSRRRLDEWSELGQSSRPLGDGSWGWLASMALVVLALGQPRWGRWPGPDAPAGHDVVLLVDVSRSMAAEDAVPDRLGVAIEAGSSLLKALATGQGDRAGVVAFAGRGVVRCPLTAHLDSAVDVLKGLRPGDVQPGGTDLGAALETAAGAFDDEEHVDGRTIVLFSDGEDHVGSWTSAVDRLKAEGIIVHCVAIGDPERGHPVPRSRPDPRKRVEEPEAETRRSDVAFEAIARATGGALVPLGLASTDLGTLFRDRIEPTARRRRDDLRIAERVERFPSFLLPAVGFGLTAAWPGLARRRGRRLAYSVLAFAALAGGAGPADGTPTATGTETATAASEVARGRQAYDAGRFAEALAAFDRAIALEPEAAVPRFDAASALFQLRRFPEAVVRYEEARTRGDDRLAVKIDYALGNAKLALGDVAEAIASYDACLATTLDGEDLEAVRLDAAANREFAAKHLKPPPEPTDPGGPKPSGSPRKRPSSRSQEGDRGDRDPSAPSDPNAPPESREGGPPGGGTPPPPSPTSSRGAGGAGGQGQAPPAEGSPQSRLDKALKSIQEARARRPPDPPPSGSKGVGKDW